VTVCLCVRERGREIQGRDRGDKGGRESETQEKGGEREREEKEERETDRRSEAHDSLFPPDMSSDEGELDDSLAKGTASSVKEHGGVSNKGKEKACSVSGRTMRASATKALAYFATLPE
jgi:hypothetical protein